MTALNHKVCTVSESNMELMAIHMMSANMDYRTKMFNNGSEVGYRVFIDPKDLTLFKLDVAPQYAKSKQFGTTLHDSAFKYGTNI